MTKLQKILKIKKNLEKKLTILNEESFRIQDILFQNNRFFTAIEIALKNDWSSTKDEQKYWSELLKKAMDGDEKSLKLLKQEFKFNASFKQKTGAFQNV